MAVCSIIGCGAWGTTLSKVLIENGHSVTLWCHDQKIKEAVATTKENPLLKTIQLPAQLKPTTYLAEAVDQAELIVIVTASKFFAATLQSLAPLIKKQPLIVSATKGLSEKSDKRMYEIMEETLPKHKDRLAVLSGPNIALEIAQQKVAAAVISSPLEKTAQTIQKMFNNSYFRVYTNTDVIGTEMGGTLKNIIAIAAGIIDGLGLGSNTKAVLMVRGMVEMSRLAVACGGKPETVMGLTGMGDLITTCSSTLSRNHFVGEQLAKGTSVKEILSRMTAVAEGVDTTKAAHDLAKQKNISMPITEQMYAVLYENKPIEQAIKELMARELKSE